jgi:hypothetical protein
MLAAKEFDDAAERFSDLIEGGSRPVTLLRHCKRSGGFRRRTRQRAWIGCTMSSATSPSYGPTMIAR